MYTFSGWDSFTFKCELGYESCDYYVYDDAHLSLSYHLDTTNEAKVIAETVVSWNKTAVAIFKSAINLFFSDDCDDFLVCPFRFAIEYADTCEFFDERDFRQQYKNAVQKAQYEYDHNDDDDDYIPDIDDEDDIFDYDTEWYEP